MQSLRLLILAIVLALLPLASAQGAGSVSCSTNLRDGGCFVERVVFSVGAVSIGVGVDAHLVWARDFDDSYLSPYATLTWASGAWVVWAELALPEGRVPVFGKPDPFRLGFSWAF